MAAPSMTAACPPSLDAGRLPPAHRRRVVAITSTGLARLRQSRASSQTSCLAALSKLSRLTASYQSAPSQCYKYEDVPGPEKDATVYISFGGLLMALRGSTRHLAEIVVGENVYCLIRK